VSCKNGKWRVTVVVCEEWVLNSTRYFRPKEELKMVKGFRV
jgi:hypothetical protein